MQSSQLEYKRYLNLVVRRKELFILLALLIMTAVFALSYLLPRKYESTSTVFIEKNVISDLVKGITVTPSMEDTINVLTYAITSRTLLGRVIDQMDLNLGKNETDADALIKRLQANTKVKVKDKNLFTISFTDKNPRLARDFVNTLVRLYIEENMSSKRGESYDASKFLSEQIDSFNVKLQKAENAVNDYKRDKGGVIAIDEGKLYEGISQAQQKLYDLQLKRRQLEGMRQATRRSSDPLQVKLAHLKSQLDELRLQYTDGFPEVVAVKGDIEQLQQQLKARKGAEAQPLDPQEVARVESEIEAIKLTERGLERYISTNKRLLESIPSAKAGLEKLELERKNQKNIYDQLFTRQGQSEVSKQMEVQDKSTTFRVVDPAVLPVTPASPNRLRIMLVGILAGLAGSFGLLLLWDQADRSFKEAGSVKALSLPLLAVIPRMEEAAAQQRRRRRFQRLSAAAVVYFIALLGFPAMEILQLPYMDRLLDQVHTTNFPQSVKSLVP